MKNKKALGISTYKPTQVVYAITLGEFSELATQYAKERFNMHIEFEAIYDENDDQRVGLYFKDPDKISTDAMNMLSDWGVAESTPFHNMDLFLDKLFRSNDYEVEDFEEFSQSLLIIKTDYKDYVENDGIHATKETDY